MATATAPYLPTIQEAEEGDAAAAAGVPLLRGSGGGSSSRGTPHCDGTTVLAIGGGTLLCLGVLGLVLYILWSGMNHKKVL